MRDASVSFMAEQCVLIDVACAHEVDSMADAAGPSSAATAAKRPRDGDDTTAFAMANLSLLYGGTGGGKGKVVRIIAPVKRNAGRPRKIVELPDNCDKAAAPEPSAEQPVQPELAISNETTAKENAAPKPAERPTEQPKRLTKAQTMHPLFHQWLEAYGDDKKLRCIVCSKQEKKDVVVENTMQAIKCHLAFDKWDLKADAPLFRDDGYHARRVAAYEANICSQLCQQSTGVFPRYAGCVF